VRMNDRMTRAARHHRPLLPERPRSGVIAKSRRASSIVTDWYDVPAVPSNSYWFLRIDWEANREYIAFYSPTWMRDLSPDKVAERAMPDESLFSKIVDLARISPDGIQTLRNGLVFELDREWYWQWYPERREPAAPQEGQVRLPVFKRIVRSLAILSADLKELSDDETRYLGQLSASAHERTYNEELTRGRRYDLVECRQMIAALTELFLEATQKKPPGPRRPKGRPALRGFSRPFGHGSFNQFVLRLLWDVRAAGGRLTLDKNLGTGTLIDALNLLRSYLPPHLVPRKLPSGTLGRIKVLDHLVASARPPHPNFEPGI
jgi:hypothetical protein